MKHHWIEDIKEYEHGLISLYERKIAELEDELNKYKLQCEKYEKILGVKSE